MNAWNGTSNPHNNQNTPDARPIPLLIVADPQRAQGFYASFLGDARFRVLVTATSPDDTQAKLAMESEAVVVEATVFNGPEEFMTIFGTCQAATFVLLPADVAPSVSDALRSTPCVRDVIAGEANFSTLGGQIYAAVQAQRQAKSSTSGSGSLFSGLQSPASTAVGWRAIAVWSPQGGVGKSTIAAALAFEAASRRLPTLLIGLGAPDPIPLANGLRPDPNIVTWQAAPTAETLRASVQTIDVLDVLTGFPNPVALHAYLPEALEGNSSLPALTSCAAHAGYAVVIIDVSSQELAAAAISAANTLVLVGLPTLPGVLNTAEAAHLVNDVMAGQHRVARQSIHLVVNKVRDTTLRPEVIKTGLDIRKDFPALAATVPDDPQIEVALNQRRPAFYHSEPLRSMTRTVGDLLFASPAALAMQNDEQLGQAARVFNLGPIRIKTN